MATDAGPLVAAVDALAAEIAHGCAGPASAAVATVRERLAGPLRVAVVGRVSSGKSTLVNALLESRIAPTAAGECTQVPCWYRYGRWETAMLRTRAGQALSLPLVDGALPRRLPVDAAEVERIDVTLAVPLLHTLTLIDTPGLSSAARDAASAATVAAADAADAVVMVVNGPLKQDEADAVAVFHARTARDPLAAGTAVAALAKADLLTGRSGVEAASRRVAGEILDAHRALFAAVVPVVGLLGETGATGRLGETEARDLAALAAAWDPVTTDLALSDHRLFTELPAPVPDARRRRLLVLLGLFGVGELLADLRAGAPAQAGPLCDRIRGRSGVGALHDVLAGVVAGRADVLKASTALHALTLAAGSPGAVERMADRVQALSDSEGMFPLRLLKVMGWIAAGRVRPPEPLQAEVAAAALGSLDVTDRTATARRVAEWRSWRMFADGPGQHTADVMVRAWQLAAQGAR